MLIFSGVVQNLLERKTHFEKHIVKILQNCIFYVFIYYSTWWSLRGHVKDYLLDLVFKAWAVMMKPWGAAVREHAWGPRAILCCALVDSDRESIVQPVRRRNVVLLVTKNKRYNIMGQGRDEKPLHVCVSGKNLSGVCLKLWHSQHLKGCKITVYITLFILSR